MSEGYWRDGKFILASTVEAEIEKLEGRVERVRGYNTDLRARVEELEEQGRLREADFCAEFPGHHITDEQIDAAWKDKFTEGSGAIHLKAKLLNIFRCEGCGGSGKLCRPGWIQKCHVCNGHRWVIVRVQRDHDQVLER
jgi:hypothetical protein